MTNYCQSISLQQKLSLIMEYWKPAIVGELNGQYIKLAKLKGEFCWHKHNYEDEMFLVLKGILIIKLRNSEIILKEGEFTIIPKGVEHLPIAEEEVEVLLFEPKTTINTGNLNNGLTAPCKFI